MTSCKTLLAVFLLTTSLCRGQTMVGLEGGMNWSNYDVKPTPGNVFGTGSGSSYGILFQSKVANELCVIVGLSHINKTIPWLVHQYLESSGPDIEFQYEFTELSASLKKEFPIYNLRPYIIAGGTYGFLISGSYIDGRFAGQTYTMDWTDNYRRSDLNLNLGLGLSYNLAESILIFTDVKYSYDLVSLNKNSANNTYIKSTQCWCGILFGN
jgi:Outer membrane protein beta-barrel domain